jgi:uridine kinase
MAAFLTTQMKADDLLSFLADEITRRKAESKPLKVAIDGRCASGKSALADKLASTLAERRLPVLRPSVDGFHHPREYRYRKGEYSAEGYYEDAYNYQTVIEHLLEPLSGNVFPVLCRQVAHDVRTDLPDTTPPVSVHIDAVLLFEGLFLFRRELDAYWDLRILLDVDPATSLARALERDTSGPADIVRRKYSMRYEPAWQIYVNEEPQAKADIIMDNRDFSDPVILKRPAPERQ